ncbi:hypothetical protein KKD70_01905 [Patescibacteria group bacterium]|nr:hypothetical protein [Patescibacteria group bacterium]
MVNPNIGNSSERLKGGISLNSQIESELNQNSDISNIRNASRDSALQILANMLSQDKKDVLYVMQHRSEFVALSDKDIALKLIDSGYAWYVLSNLDRFQELDKEVALKLIASLQKNSSLYGSFSFEPLSFTGLDQEVFFELYKNSHNSDLLNQLDRFTGLDKWFALILDKHDLAVNLNKFSGLDSELALKLIEDGYVYEVENNLDSFEGLSNQVAVKLIQYSDKWRFASNLKRFKGLSCDIALELIKAGEAEFVGRYLDRFKNLDQEVALKLIEAGFGFDVVNNIGKFIELDTDYIFEKVNEKSHKKLEYLEGSRDLNKEKALSLINDEEAWYVARNLIKFRGLDEEIALKLIDVGFGYDVLRNLDKFEGFDTKVLLKWIETGAKWYFFTNFEKLPYLDHKKFVLKLIEVGDVKYVTQNLYKVNGLDKEVALELIKAGESTSVARYLDRFKYVDNEVAEKLIKAGESVAVAASLYRFAGVDHLKIAEKLGSIHVLCNLEKFEGIDQEKIISDLIRWSTPHILICNLFRINSIPHEKIADALIDAGFGKDVAENIKKFQGLDYLKIGLRLKKLGFQNYILEYFVGSNKDEAIKLLELGKIDELVEGIKWDKFNGLNKEFAIALIENGYSRIVGDKFSAFVDLKSLNIDEINSIIDCYSDGTKQIFNKGLEVFGESIIIEIITAREISRSLRVLNFMLNIRGKSELSPQAFYDNFMGPAIKALKNNDLVFMSKLHGLDSRFSEVFSIAKANMEHIPSIKRVLLSISSVKDVFRSLDTLDEFKHLCDVLYRYSLIDRPTNKPREDYYDILDKQPPLETMLDYNVPKEFLTEFRKVFLDLFSNLDEKKPYSEKAFQFNPQMYYSIKSIDLRPEDDLLEYTNRLRHLVPNAFRMRSTTQKYMNDARKRVRISGKKVDEWYEHDIGSIATYYIDMNNTNLSNEHLLYRLGLTLMKEIEWAFHHRDHRDPHKPYFKIDPSSLTDLEKSLQMLEGIKDENEFPEIITFFDCSIQKDIKNRFDRSINGRSAGFYLDGNDCKKFLGSKKGTFCEMGYQSNTLEGVNASYIKIPKSIILKIFRNLLDENSEERALFNKLKAKSKPGCSTVIYDTFCFLLTERLLYQLFLNLEKTANVKRLNELSLYDHSII